MAGDSDLVYGDDRVRRLRIALGVAAGLCVLFGVLALLGAGQAEDGRTAALLIAVIGFSAAGWSVVTWRALARPDARAKRLVIAIGATLVLLGLLTGPVVLFSLPFALLGLSTIFLGVLADEVP